MYDAQVNLPLQLDFVAPGVSAPATAQLSLTVTPRDGASISVPAYWAGEDRFAVRVALSEPGTYVYELHGTDGDVSPNRSGEIRVSEYTGDNDLYHHGRIRIAEGSRKFEHADGHPFFWLGDTQWQMFTTRLDWPDGFAHLESDRADKGFSVVQVVAGPLPDFDEHEAWHVHQANEGGWPWTEGWGSINPAFYDFVDRKIVGLIEHGLMPCIVGMWGFWLPIMGRERVEAHWRYLVARYGAYPVVWCLAGEVQMGVYANQRAGGAVLAADLAEQGAGWTSVAGTVRAFDPYGNLMTAHPAAPDNGPDYQLEDYSPVPGSGRAVLLRDDALDFDMLQPGHYGFQLLDTMVEIVDRAVAVRPSMPVVNAETNYEGIAGSSWEDQQRFQFWTSMTDDCAGYTYGAAGIWQFWTVDEFSKGGDSENVENAGGGPWQEVMHLPGSRQVGLGRKFFSGLPWKHFRRIDEHEVVARKRHSSFATGIPGVISVYYVPSGLEPETSCGILKMADRRDFWWRVCLPVQVGDGSYEAYWVDPRTLNETPIGIVVPEGGIWTPPPKPSLLDWVLVVVDRQRLLEYS